MEELITKLLQDNFKSGVIVVILIVAGLIFIVWWARGIYEKIHNLPCASNGQKIDSLASLSAKIEGLQCEDHRRKLEGQIDKHTNIETAIGKIETSISFMQKSIDGLSQNLQKNKGLITDPFTQRQSPLQITSKGHEMAEKLGIFDMIEDNWIRIRFFLEENAESRNPYDIQQFCIEQAVVFPDKFLREDEINKIKLDAYAQGEALSSYMKVIAVIVRDKYFEEHNIDVEDVDRHEPKA